MSSFRDDTIIDFYFLSIYNNDDKDDAALDTHDNLNGFVGVQFFLRGDIT